MIGEQVRQNLTVARKNAFSLTVFRDVVADEVGRQFLALLDDLTSGSAVRDSIPHSYGRLFAMLAEEAELYRGDPVGDAWQNHLLDRLLAAENAFSRKAEGAPWEEMGPSLVAAVRFDLRSLQSLYLLDAGVIARAVEHSCLEDGAGNPQPNPLPSQREREQDPSTGKDQRDVFIVGGAPDGMDHCLENRLGNSHPNPLLPPEEGRREREQDAGGDLPRWDAFRASGGGGAHGGSTTDLKMAFARSLDWTEMTRELAGFYRGAGAGDFARYRAFRWTHRDGEGLLEGIANPDLARLDDLIGYDVERELLMKNTAYFVAGYPANNVLLYGDRGTGKSSTVKALLSEFGDRGLRLVEVPKQHLDDFPRMLALLRHRRERFILFVDDLSFEDNETHYKELKAVLEGSLEARPENVLLYATSNRRHLIRERFADRREGFEEEIHPGDTFEEKLSLSDRFGITITFLSPNQERYLAIVRGLAEQRGLRIAQGDLEYRALQWAIQHNGRSGRTARQFIDFLTGELGGKLRP